MSLDMQADAGKNMRLDIAEGFPSGQRGQTVNLLAQPSEVRILLPPPLASEAAFAPGGMDDARV